MPKRKEKKRNNDEFDERNVRMEEDGNKSDGLELEKRKNEVTVWKEIRRRFKIRKRIMI